MKKFLFILALLSIGSTAFGKGANVIYVDDVILPVGGGNAALLVNINLTEKNSAKGMMFTITLPSGVEFVKNGDAPVCYNGSMYGVDPTLNLKNANTLTLTVASTKTVKGSKGLLYAFKVKCTDSSFSGKGTISGIQASIDGNPVDIGGSEFNITTTDCDVVLDENSPFDIEDSNNDVKIFVKRTLKGGNWSTICLPFDLDWSTFKSIFGQDVVLAEFDSYTKEDEENLSVDFAATDMTSDHFYGNWPYLIKTSKDITDFQLTSKIEVGEAEADYETGSGKNKKTVGKFIGTYIADTYVPQNNIFISGNKFYYSIGTSKIKGFRGYFWFKDQLSNTATCRAFVDGNPVDDATGISSKYYISENKRIYSISGRYMGENVDMKTLPKGVYIVDGVKIIND